MHELFGSKVAETHEIQQNQQEMKMMNHGFQTFPGDLWHTLDSRGIDPTRWMQGSWIIMNMLFCHKQI